MTICPAQLVASLGGADRLRATRAFSDVRDLADGAALLQATPGPRGYGVGAAARVLTTLGPVLPARTQDVYR